MPDEHSPILVVDLEATCWKSGTPEGEPQSIHNMEIIEIGCVLTNRQGAVLDTRSFMVRPERKPVLSAFCTELTHITQAMVDSAQTLPNVIAQMNAWLDGTGADLLWCSWGNYDLNHLTAQCTLDNADSKLLHLSHLNLKKLWRRTTKQRKKTSLASALAYHGLTFDGQPHRGIDDARNITRLLPFLNWSLADGLDEN
ncbi:MAG: 3'-5' exonuclease [Pseudomonas profundi]|uniref:3'-5' exonuclease n=1 Tax=Pseudomonas profundi TaxID=1981513 RepID=UPI003002502F